MPAPQIALLRSSVNAVLAAVKAELALRTGLAADRIRVVARHKRPPHFSAPQDLLLVDRGFAADPAHRDRHDCRIQRRLAVVVRTRTELGESDSDDAWVMNPADGNVIAEEAVIDALQNFLPEDAKRNTLLFEPMRVLSGTPREKESDGWGEVELLFQMGIQLPLSQSRV